jgi:hypothetical protein
MPLYKSAQILELDEDILNNIDDDQVILYEEKPDMEDVVELHHGEEPEGLKAVELSFSLPMLPGSDAPVVEEMPEEIEIEEGKSDKKDGDKNKAEDTLEVDDPWSSWKKKGPGSVTQWAHDMMTFIPAHSGKEIFGAERAIAYLKKVVRELSGAVQTDLKGEINISDLEGIRSEILGGIERLENHKEKLEKQYNKKKTSEQYSEIVKEGQKAAGVGHVVVTVPQLISSLARTAINSSISAGKDIEVVVGNLVKQFDLNNREQVELYQTLCDMNYPLRRPRCLDFDKEFDATSVDNNDYMANYYS